MKKIYSKLLLILFVVTANLVSVAQVITSFSPVSGPVGTTVIISGSGFSTTPSQNIVRFDNVKANVSAATATSLTVTVPYGTSSYAAINVTKGGIQRSSANMVSGTRFFKVTFSGGTFSAANYETQVIPLNATSEAVATADMNADGLADIITLLDYSGINDSMKVYRNNGTLGYTLISTVLVGNLSNSAMAIADIDNDGDLDVAISIYTTSSDIKFFVNNGAGVLTASGAVSAGYCLSLVPGDLNGDGYVDFVASSGNWYINKIMNNQNGTFTSSQINSNGAEAVAVADFNNDGKLDVFASRFSSTQYELYIGSGTGGFTSQGLVGSSIQVAKAVPGDFNNDGNLDVAYTGYTASKLAVALGNGNGTFAAAATVNAANARDVRLGDFDGDGITDAESMIYTGGLPGFYLYKGSATGTFNTPLTVAGASSAVSHSSASVSDMNNDGKPDIVTCNMNGNDLRIHYYAVPLSVTITGSTNVTCNGGSNGTATTSVTGGFGPYTYSWTGGSTVANPTNLTAGTKTVTVTDAIGATATATVTLTQPAAITSTSTQTNVNCFGMTTGSATVTASGGTSPYTYSWAPSGGTSNIGNGLGAGTYTCTITDNVGCTGTRTLTITQPAAPLSASTSAQNNVSCFGGTNGSATVSVTGGTSPYSYSWAPSGGTTASISGRSANTYTCTVTDNKGCVLTHTVSITQPAAALASSVPSFSNVSCNGGTDGSALVMVTGGTSPYSYNWTPSGGTGPSISGRTAGTYTCTITDFNGCVKTQTVTLTQPAALSSSIGSQTNVSCNGGTNGSATVFVTGGTTPYSYSWAPAGGTAATANSLAAGTYTCTITDNNSCVKTQTVSITQPSGLSATISAQTNISCNGGTNGSATVSVTGGTTPYSYSWAPAGGTAATANSLAAGTYTCTITDNNSCSTTQTVSLTQPSALSSSISSQTNVSCNGGNNGAATVSVSGGTTPYTYSWAPSGGTAATANSLAAGTYTCTITDNNSCTTTQTVSISQPGALSASISAQTNVSCNGGNNGAATVSVTGGTTPYSYSWAPAGGTTASISGRTAGTYTCTITDNNSCITTQTVSLTQPALLNSSISAQTNVSCNGGNNGAASVSVTGGTTPYSYSWAPAGGTAATANTLAAGTYTCTITDNNACVKTQTLTISEPALLNSSISAQTNVTCNGGTNGTATVSVTGGTTPYSYSWAPAGGTAASASSLAAGTYTCTITDNNSCVKTQTVTITEPGVISISFSTVNATCSGSNGSATASVTGGAGGYSYAWDAAAGNQTTATASSLSAGSYVLTVTDLSGCIANNIANVSNTGGPTLSVSSTDATCFGLCNGSATVTPTGGTAPYFFSWAPGGATTATATGQCAGTKTITVTDNIGCVVSTTVTVGQPAAISGTISKTDVSCFGGSNGTASISATGGTTPYTYSWAPSGGTAANISGRPAGTYTCTITDANACTGTQTVTISEPAVLATSTSQTDVSCFGGSNGSATVTVGGGTAPYSYSWAPAGGTAATATGLSAGTFTCTITDNNLCSTTATVSITQPIALSTTSSVTNVSCNGLNNGSATVTPAGGTSPYSYSWTPAGGTAATATNLSPASYTCTVTDNNGCTTGTSVSITEPAVLNASIGAQSNVSCNGGNNGSATISVTGGTTSYSYNWAPSGGTAASAGSLTAGTYTCTITDANSCVTSQTVSITEPLSLTATSMQTPVSCFGGNNGTVTALPMGGTSPYTYSWSPVGGTAATATGLSAGSYTCTITDNNSCTTITSVIVNEPTQLTVTESHNNVSCNAGNNGDATANVSGGTSPYNYSWTPVGGSAATANGLTAGVYTCTVTDNNGCSTPVIVSITEPAALLLSSSQNDVSCNGGSNGDATVSASGGTSSYSYSWLPSGGTNATATGLSAGTYTCTVTDANSCSNNITITINQPALLFGTITSSDVLCNGGSTGNASISVTGGVASYTYSWSPTGGTNANATNLTAGTYTCDVTDANGCTTSNTVIINQPLPLVATETHNDVSCNGGNDGSITVGETGGVAPYSYNWSTGGITATETGLSAGSYMCTVTDANGCTALANIAINEPTAIISSITPASPLCNGGTDGAAIITASGGTGALNYSWSPAGGTTASASGLTAGDYTCTVTDANACVHTNTVTITEPAAISSVSSGTNVNCFGGNDGTASVSASGGTGSYTYNWSSGGTTANETGLSAGTYTCIITDANACTINEVYTVNEPPVFSATITQLTSAGCTGGSAGSAQIVLTGGISPYSYSWTSGGTTDTETGLSAQTYTCNYTDNNGCTGSASITIATNPDTDIYGELTFPGGTISSGFVFAFKQQASINGIDTIAIVPVTIGPTASYLFPSLPADNYYIKVLLDTTAHPTSVPTYYGNAFEWDSSLVVSHGCLVNDTADIDVLEVLPGTGTGFISGYIIEGPGFGILRINGGGGTPLLPLVPGGPLKGIDVKLGKNPSGGIQARTTSDTTGYYEFTHVPDGGYNIYVDIPNLPMDSLRFVTIAPGSDTSLQNNYYADSLFIYIDTNQYVGIHSSALEYENKFSIYPNPSTGIINLQFNTTGGKEEAKVLISDAAGRELFATKSIPFAKGTQQLTFNASTLNLKSGVYFVSIIVEGRRYTQRLIIL